MYNIVWFSFNDIMKEDYAILDAEMTVWTDTLHCLCSASCHITICLDLVILGWSAPIFFEIWSQ